jgi:hypothetical protein
MSFRDSNCDRIWWKASQESESAYDMSPNDDSCRLVIGQCIVLLHRDFVQDDEQYIGNCCTRLTRRCSEAGKGDLRVSSHVHTPALD